MGEVYKAVDPTLQRTVAIKTVRPDIDRPEYLERMYREAQACARLNHPHIVTVYEAGEIEGVVYIAMEYLKGDNLANVLQRGTMTFEEKIRTLMQVLEALDHAHKQDVIHRDIKPSNVHIQEDGSVKLVDFGLARMVAANTLTISGTIVGTPHYASPEQLRGEAVDRRTDIYSTGALAYEMLAGKLPFRGEDDSISTVILRVVSQPPPPMESTISRAIPELETIVQKAMAKARDDRYQTAIEMRNALARVLTSATEVIRKVDSEIDRTIVIPKGGPRATTVTVPPPPEYGPAAVSPSSAPTIASTSQRSAVPPAPQAVAAADAPKSSGRMWALIGAAAAIVLAVAVYAMLPQSSPETTTQPPAPAANPPAASAPATPAPAPVDNATKPSNPAAATKTAAVPPPQKKDAPATNPAATATPAASSTNAAPTPAEPAKFAGEIDAKELFSGQKVGLRYRLEQKTCLTPNCDRWNVKDVDLGTRFKTGDDVRFAFESNTDGFLYVIIQGSSGKWDVLYPNPEINGGRNQIKKGQELLIPNGDWFSFDGPAGSEQIYVLLSKEQLSTLPGFGRPVTTAETVSAATVSNVQSSQVRSRDLKFKKDTGGSVEKPVNVNYVVNPQEVSNAVSASITLTHGQ
jgi:serine/threonine-protein kinase